MLPGHGCDSLVARPDLTRVGAACAIKVCKAQASSMALRDSCGHCRTHGRWPLLPSYPPRPINGRALPNAQTRECNTSPVKLSLPPPPGATGATIALQEGGHVSHQ